MIEVVTLGGLSVLALGGHAVHIAYHVTWGLEHVDPGPEHTFGVLPSIRDLPRCVEAIAGAAAGA